MRLNVLTIHNFRSIRDVEMKCRPSTVLIGANNHGKSNILLALEFLLSPAAKPSTDDLFAFHDAEDADLWVEGTFSDLTEQERTTFAKYVRPDGTMRVRKTAHGGEVGYRGYIQQPDIPWMKPEAVEALLERPALDLTDLKQYAPLPGKLTKKQVIEAQEKYLQQNRDKIPFVEVLETTPFLGTKNVAGGLLPDLYLVPAVRDLSDETKIKTTTMFGRLVNRAIQEMTLGDERFRDAAQKLDALARAFNASEGDEGSRPAQLTALERSVEAELDGWGVKVGIELLPPAVEKLFELGTSLHLDDGHRTLAEKKGHGLQRAVMFALLRAWAKALRAPRDASEGAEALAPRKSSDSIIFAFEEPELFLHPHAQRRLATTIREIGGAAGHQVFVSTHSTHFVDVGRSESICVVTKENASAGTRVKQCDQELFAGDENRKKRFQMCSWVNPDRGEMFFARKVALVEGETERKLFPFLAEILGCMDPDVSVVDCGSKHNLCLYVAIANAFKLRYVVVHDEDPVPIPLPADEDQAREKKHTFALNEEIKASIDASLGAVEVLAPELERVAGISKTQGEKKGKALAALDHFAGKVAAEIPSRLAEVTRSIYRT